MVAMVVSPFRSSGRAHRGLDGGRRAGATAAAPPGPRRSGGRRATVFKAWEGGRVGAGGPKGELRADARMSTAKPPELVGAPLQPSLAKSRTSSNSLQVARWGTD